jgi:transposase
MVRWLRIFPATNCRARLNANYSSSASRNCDLRKITGAILLSVIGDVNDFPDEGRLASYFGIVPRVSNSNETERSGRIHKRGTKLGRTALVQSALIAAQYSPYLKRFYEKVKARRGAGKAIIALARKVLGTIYRTLKNKWVFEDFPNFVLAEGA